MEPDAAAGSHLAAVSGLQQLHVLALGVPVQRGEVQAVHVDML